MYIGTGSFATDEIFFSAGMVVYVVALTFVLGSVFGSFINCAAWRMTHGQSVIRGRSHCPGCGHVLGARDLVPVVSFLALRGKCRYCGRKISPRYVITELISGLWFTACVLRYGLSAETLRAVILFCLLLALSLVDLDTQEIPDRFPMMGILCWAVTLPFLHGNLKENLIQSLAGAAAIGGGMLVLSLIFDRVSGKESMGGGDIKLYFVCGLYLGPWKGLLLIILSSILGLCMAAAMHKKKDQPFPFGPAIAVAAMLCLLYGDGVVRWYMGLLQGGIVE